MRSTCARAFLCLATICALLLSPVSRPLFAQEPTVPSVPSEVDSTPGLVPFGGVTSISSGEEGSCALTSASVLFCWGNGSNGQNGDGVAALQSLPVAVTTLSNVT